MSKITYTDKVNLSTDPTIADINKISDDDMNEIKQVVNTNDDNVGDLTNLSTTTKSSVVGAINELVDNNVFSTTEKKIGKWYNGKDLYERVLIIQNIVADNQEHQVSIDTDIDDITFLYAYLKSTNEIWPMGYENPNARDWQRLYVKADVTYHNLNYLLGNTATGVIVVTMRYTKSI